MDSLIPNFGKINETKDNVKSDKRSIHIPANRVSPLKARWEQIYKPIVNELKLMIRFNIGQNIVEIKTSDQTDNQSAIQKAEDFIKAFATGFEVEDAMALIRLDELFVESFQVTDGEHLSRAIGRIAGSNGRTRYTIENSTKTRIVLAGQKIHILGSFQNIRLARNAICNLILGRPPSKVYGQMRNVASKIKHSF